MDVIGQGREPERDPRPLARRWRVAGWGLAVVAGLGVIGLGVRHGTGSPGSAATATAAPATWAIAHGGLAESAVTALQGPVMALAINAGGPGMICSPSTGACSVRVQAGRAVTAPTEPANPGAATRPALRAPSLW
jgi:hypothetical protein